MAKQVQRINSKQVDALPEGRWSDGDGLQLVVKKSGSRSWVVSFRVDGARKEMGLGSAKDVSLAKARELAADARKVARKGVSPLDARRAEERVEETFKTYATTYIEEREAGWVKTVRANWRNSLLNHCGKLADKTPREITTKDVTAVLKPIWKTKPEIAQKTQMRLARVLDAAKVDGLREGENPARWRGHLEHVLTERQKLTRGHHASLPYADAPAFMTRLRARQGLGALALELTMLCGVRTSEALLATWGEFDLKAKVWSIPAERTKNRRTLKRLSVTHHRIPLSDAAVAVLIKAGGAGDAGDFVFPGTTAGKPISTNSMSAVLKRLKVPVTVHGFRSTVRDWAGDARAQLGDRTVPAYSWEAAEITLGHVVGNEAQRAYRRGDALEERRTLLQDWAAYLDEGDSAALSLAA